MVVFSLEIEIDVWLVKGLKWNKFLKRKKKKNIHQKWDLDLLVTPYKNYEVSKKNIILFFLQVQITSTTLHLYILETTNSN